MMEESRTQRLHELLRRLGKALHGSVVRSDEVRSCLEDLHADGWNAVMLLETSLVCADDGSVDVDRATMRLHVDGERVAAEYRIGVDDAHFLSSIGIAAGRHRSAGRRASRPTPEQENDPRS